MPVVIIKNKLTYADEAIDQAVKEELDFLGVANELKKDMRVVIKPNLLAARTPRQSVTTHPAVIHAVIRYLHESGIQNITIAESPGGVWSESILKKLYTVCGLLPFESEVKLNYDLSYGTENGFSLMSPILESDYIINLCKLKTHGLTTMTGAVKNLFGCIPGLQKPEWHCKKPKLHSFCEMLIRLCETVRPNVTVMDAIDCMQGNGPGGGETRHMGYLLASRSPYAIDETAAELMGFSPEDMPLIRAARSLAPMADETVLKGDPVLPADPPFTLPEAIAGKEHFYSATGILHVFYRRTVPSVNTDLCTGCGKCAENCPKHLIQIKNGNAHMSHFRCISCFCCQEMCPSHAIFVKKRFL